MDSDSEGRALPTTWSDLLKAENFLVLVTVCVAVCLHAADSMIVATMLPSMVAEIGGSNLISWTVTLYELGTIATGAISGLLASRFGVRIPMAIAAGTFAAGCIISALAPNMWVVLIGRFVQGVGGGGLMTLSYVATGVFFPAALIPKAMAVVSSVWGASAFLGPLFGGLFVEYSDWRTGFWVFAFIAWLIAFWIAYLLKNPKLDSSKNSPTQEINIQGVSFRLALLVCGVLCFAYSGVDIEIVRTTSLIVSGIIFLIMFAVLDSRTNNNRLLPRAAYKLGSAVNSIYCAILCFAISTIAVTSYASILLVTIHKVSALTAGYIVVCTSIGWTLASIAVSNVNKSQDFYFIFAGMTTVILSILGLMFSVSSGPIWLVAIFAGLEGAGFGMAWSFIVRQVSIAASKGEVERAVGAVPTIHRLGYAIGASYLGIIANSSGFSEGISPESAEVVSFMIFAAGLPFATIGILALLHLKNSS